MDHEKRKTKVRTIDEEKSNSDRYRTRNETVKRLRLENKSRLLFYLVPIYRFTIKTFDMHEWRTISNYIFIVNR